MHYCEPSLGGFALSLCLSVSLSLSVSLGHGAEDSMQVLARSTVCSANTRIPFSAHEPFFGLTVTRFPSTTTCCDHAF